MKFTLSLVLGLFLGTSVAQSNFDVACLGELTKDSTAMEALKDLSNLRLDQIQLDDTDGIFNFESLLISEKIACQPATSTVCEGIVQVIPPEEEVQMSIDQIMDEVSQMSDDRLLELLDYDVNSLCIRVTTMDNALKPHYECINKNVKAFHEAGSIQKTIIELALKGLGLTIEGFSEGLMKKLGDGCDSFKSTVATTLRRQLTSDFWNTAVTSLVSQYDLESFETTVNNDKSFDYKPSLGCTIPDELVCAKHVSSFASACLMISRRELDFEGDDWKLAHSDVSQTLTYDYPCTDTFQDSCMGTYLVGKPDLLLEQGCGSLEFYYQLSGETVPTDSPSPSSTSAPTPSPISPTGTPTDAPPSSTLAPTSSPTISDLDGSNNDKGKMSGGLIALIIVVVVAVVLAIAFIGYLYNKKRIPVLQNEYQIQL